MVLVKYWTLRWESGARGGRGQSQQTSLQNLSVYVIILGWGWRLASRPRVVLPPHDRELAAMVGVVLLERSLHFSEETPIERILPSPYSCPACISLHLAHRGMRCDHNLSSGFIKKKNERLKKSKTRFIFLENWLPVKIEITLNWIFPRLVGTLLLVVVWRVSQFFFYINVFRKNGKGKKNVYRFIFLWL